MNLFWRRRSAALCNSRTFRRQPRQFRIESLEPRAMLSVNGDFNGDGYDDLAIGVPEEDIGGVAEAGAVNVIYGSSIGLTPINPQFWHQDRPGVNGVVAASEHFGTALAVGDFNGDGYSDLAIGVPGKTVNGIGGAGAVNVLYGSASGLSASNDQQWTQDTPGVNDSAEAGDLFGVALAAGDFDGDGRDDLAIGVANESVDGVNGAGMVNVLYGSNSGLTYAQDQTWHQNSSGINEVAELSDGFGFKLAAGDFDGDGRDDLAIGVARDSVGALAEAGLVNVIYGSASGLTNAGDQVWHQNSAGINDSAAAMERFGTALAVGDFDDDGRDDLAIGVPEETVSGAASAGMVNVIYGSNSGLRGIGDQVWSQDTSAGIFDVSEANDEFGTSLAAGDFNGDGRDDLAIGVPREDLNGVSDVGAVNVLFGSVNGLSANNDVFWHQDSPNFAAAAEADDRYGDSLTTGDYDGDGRADLVIGAPFEGIGGAEDAGAILVIYNYGQIDPLHPGWDQSDLYGDDDPEASDHFGGVLA